MKMPEALRGKIEAIRKNIEKVEVVGIFDAAAIEGGLIFTAYGLHQITYSPEEMAKKAGVLITGIAFSTAALGLGAFIYRMRQRHLLWEQKDSLQQKLWAR